MDYEKKLTREINKRTSFMNNTKWKTLFTLLDENAINLRAKIKLLLDPTERDFTLNGRYSKSDNYCLEEYWGAAAFKEIEWIKIPKSIEFERKNRNEFLSPRTTEQSITKLKTLLANTKKFEFEELKDHLIIYGHK